MAGSHIEREARYAKTGLTGVQRDELILQLRRRGWAQHKIATHLGMTQPAVKYALDRLAGKKRNRTSYAMCEGCGRNFPKEQVNNDGLCEGCAE